MSEITFFAKTNFRNQETSFGIKTDDRRRHTYIIGKTGMGKTNLLENMVIQDIKNGHGVCYIDPHGDTAEKLLKAIPADRINDVIYFNPADQDFPIAFNVMERVDPAYRHLVASGLVGVFKKIWADSWGPRLEYILRNAILALLEYPGSTLLGVTRILVDKKYRIRVVNKVTDPVVRAFWVDEFTKWNDRVLQEVISPIQNKVGQFISSSLIRNIVGQTTSSFDVRKIMDERKILIMNLSKGRVGEDASALLGAMMITKIQLAAMGRVDIPEEERKDFYLYVDEFQNFATESFANILSEARKYRLNLILANQYITQLDETVRDSIFGNAGTLISFRVGASDAEYLEREFAPRFTENDLVNLPKYNVYLKLMIDGIAGDAFSAKTLPPIDLADTTKNEEKIISVSRERYASSREEVEQKIVRWSGVLMEEEESAVRNNTGNRENNNRNYEAPKKVGVNRNYEAPKDNDESKREQNAIPSEDNKSEEKTLYETVCDTCELKIQVPFKPDGKRPTFCKECLKDYQRAMARAKERAEEEGSTAEEQGSDNRKEKIIVEKFKPAKKGREPKEFVKEYYAPKDKPLNLSQLKHVSPKKFKNLKKQEIDLDEVRKIIKENFPGSDKDKE